MPCCLALHSLHCTDKCPMGRSSPWPRLTLAARLAILALPTRRSLWRPSGECWLIHDRIHATVRCRAAAADFRGDDRALRSVGRSLLARHSGPRCHRKLRGPPGCDWGRSPYSILDLGCGPGRDLRYFRSLGHDVVGLDGSTEFVAMARSYSGCEVL